MKRLGEVAYIVTLLLFYDVFHVFHLMKYILDLSHVIQVDDVQVREKLTIVTSPSRIEDIKVKHLRGNEIALVKVVWGRPVDGSMTWELESQMRESYLTLFPSGNF